MKHLEDMLAKEQARTIKQNQLFQNRMETLVKSQLNHSATVEQLKFKNDQTLKFKSVPTTEDYRRFLAKIDPGKVKGKRKPSGKKKAPAKQTKNPGRPGKISRGQSGEKMTKTSSVQKTSNLKHQSNVYLNPQKIILREDQKSSS